MKRFIILTCVAGVTGWLGTGCEENHKPRPAKAKTNHVARVAQPKPPKPAPIKPAKVAKEVLPGTPEYLDVRNGFRDVTFGESETNIANLVMNSQDEARQLKTCVRAGDNLSLHGIPVESIEYNFFKGQLYAVRVKWKIQHPESALRRPPTTDMSVYCAQEYGAPRTRQMREDGAEFTWYGHKVELYLTESLLPGVADSAKGGWVFPPTTTGRMLMRNLSLSRAAETGLAGQTTQGTDGF